MALINCKNCGKMISDKAKACPHCGTPVDFKQSVNDQSALNQNQEAEVPPSIVVAPEPVESFEEPKRKSRAGLIIAAVLGLLAVLGIGGWLWYDNNQKRVEQERQMAILAEKARQDSIAAAELREQARQDSIAEVQKQEKINTIYNEYVKVLKRHHDGRYFLFDITKDDVPELWTIYPDSDISEWPNILSVYGIENNSSKIIYTTESCTRYYKGDNYIIANWCWIGDDFQIIKMTYNGNTITERVIRTYSWEEEDNIKISEPAITQYDVSDTESLKQQIKSYFED